MLARCVAPLALLFASATAASARPDAPPRGTGDLGLVVERAIGRLQVVETTNRTSLGQIDGLVELSHASIVYGRDGRPARGIVVGRLADGARFVANTPDDAACLPSFVACEQVGRAGHVRREGEGLRFVPA